MFSEIISFPIKLLRNVTIWEESIGKHVPLAVFKVYRFLIRYIFVYIPVILESIHLKAFESFEVCIRCDIYFKS